jgi:ornithine cyclodeaminase
MLFVPEETSQELVTRSMALTAVRNAFIAAADGSAVSFPTLQGTGRDAQHRFSVKAARVNAASLTGMKVGAYWPSSDNVGLSRGSSMVLFLDETSGRVEAMVQTSSANAYRTSAADALAVELLARRDANTLAIFGAGHQAFHEVIAICEVRPITQVLIVNRTADRADALIARLGASGIVACHATAREACENSDIVVTITGSRQPLFDDSWIKQGTHVSCMGTDDRGKQELPVELLRRSRLFADLVAQSREVGEFQHVATEILSGSVHLDALGDVAIGRKPGRRSDEDITIFDSSGIALQDIFLARMILSECERQDKIVRL